LAADLATDLRHLGDRHSALAPSLWRSLIGGRHAAEAVEKPPKLPVWAYEIFLKLL
jgi:hypothetical protein